MRTLVRRATVRVGFRVSLDKSFDAASGGNHDEEHPSEVRERRHRLHRPRRACRVYESVVGRRRCRAQLDRGLRHGDRIREHGRDHRRHDQDLDDLRRPRTAHRAEPGAGDRQRGRDDEGRRCRHQRARRHRRAPGGVGVARPLRHRRDPQPGPRPASVRPGDRGRQAVRRRDRGRADGAPRAVRRRGPRLPHHHDGQLAREPLRRGEGSALLAGVAHLGRARPRISRVAETPRRRRVC